MLEIKTLSVHLQVLVEMVGTNCWWMWDLKSSAG